MVPPPVRVRAELRAFVRTFGVYRGQRRRNALFPPGQANEDFVLPDLETQRQVIFGDERATVEQTVLLFLVVELVVDGFPVVGLKLFLLISNNKLNRRKNSWKVFEVKTSSHVPVSGLAQRTRPRSQSPWAACTSDPVRKTSRSRCSWRWRSAWPSPGARCCWPRCRTSRGCARFSSCPIGCASCCRSSGLSGSPGASSSGRSSYRDCDCSGSRSRAAALRDQNSGRRRTMTAL